MSAAALSPRVRALVVSDEAFEHDTEAGVYTLEGARLSFEATTFPCIRSLWVYLLLSYPRGSRFEGQVRLLDDRDEKVIRYAKFSADFSAGDYLIPVLVEMDNCSFPAPGSYTFQVHFSTRLGDAQKSEQSFHVRPTDEE
jgi:hypothetical protein